MRDLPSMKRLTDAYDAYLLLERGMSENTRMSYRSDVEKLVCYLSDGKTTLRDVTLDTLHNLRRICMTSAYHHARRQGLSQG